MIENDPPPLLVGAQSNPRTDAHRLMWYQTVYNIRVYTSVQSNYSTIHLYTLWKYDSSTIKYGKKEFQQWQMPKNKFPDRNTQGGMLRISSDLWYHDYTVFESTLKKTCPPARKKHAILGRLSRLFSEIHPFFCNPTNPVHPDAERKGVLVSCPYSSGSSQQWYHTFICPIVLIFPVLRLFRYIYK